MNLKNALIRATSHARGLVGDLALISTLCGGEMVIETCASARTLAWKVLSLDAENLCNGASRAAVWYAGGETGDVDIQWLMRCSRFTGEVEGAMTMATDMVTPAERKLRNAVIGAHANIAALIEIHVKIEAARVAEGMLGNSRSAA